MPPTAPPADAGILFLCHYGSLSRCKVGEEARVRLTEEQRTELDRWVHGQRIEFRLRFRATLVWHLLVEGASEDEVAQAQGTSVKTVRMWRRRKSCVLNLSSVFRHAPIYP